MRLNEIKEKLRIDKNKEMLNQILNFSGLIKKGLEDGKKCYSDLDLSSEIKRIVWYGMGASGLVGEYIKYYLLATGHENLSFDIFRGYRPQKVDDASLSVFYTYSGNTFETLTALNLVLNRTSVKKENILIFSSDGTVRRIAEQNNLNFVSLPPGYVSRSHIPYGLSKASVILGLMTGINSLYNFDSCFDLESKVSDHFDNVSQLFDIAKNIAKKLPIIVTDSLLKPVSTRFMAQLNENSKYIGLTFEVPESGHNLITGLRDFLDTTYLLILRRNSEDEILSRYMTAVEQMLSNYHKFIYKIHDDSVSWRTFLEPTVFIDIISVILADLRGKNSFDINEITRLKSLVK